MYKKLLKELNKGNAVLLFVRGSNYNEDRYRILTPNTCYFDYTDDDYGGGFVKSCFVGDSRLSSESVVNYMSSYDRCNNLKITKMQVLK